MSYVLLFGGSFDPVHNGHLIVARHVAEQLDIGRVVLIPSAVPPHKQDRTLAPAEHRLAMCRLVTDHDPQFEVSDWELSRTGPNYTLNTITHFRTTPGHNTELCWLIGMDSLNELGTWYHAGELVDACTIVTAARPGFEPDEADLRRHFTSAQVEKLCRHIIPGPRIDISSTNIRQRVAAHRSIRYLVPPEVCDYIHAHRLYLSPASD